MNFKTIFLTILLSCSLAPSKAEAPTPTAEDLLSFYLAYPGRDHEVLLAYAHPTAIRSLILWSFRLPEQEREKIAEALRYFLAKKPELIQTTFEHNILDTLAPIEVLKVLKELGADPYKKMEDRDYNWIQCLEARVGLKPLKNVRANNCNPSKWDRFFGNYSKYEIHECKVLQEKLDALK